MKQNRSNIGRQPDKMGHFGPFGGKFVPETLMKALEELELAYRKLKNDSSFKAELRDRLHHFVGRPTPLYHAANLTKKCGGASILLKREDLCHTGAHKINNTVAQALLAVRLGKRRIVAETGAGQHGLATATAARLFNLDCVVYMGEEDIHRQSLNVYKMKLLGAKICPVKSGARTLKDATNEAIRDWVTTVETTHYLLGSTVGPHPYPMLVRDFQTVIGREVKRQIRQYACECPDEIIACVGGGSNSMGIFYPFLNTKARLWGVEAGGEGVQTERHAAPLAKGRVGVLHGMKSYVLQDRDGQITLAHSISAGLDYPGVGPEHSFLKETGRVNYDAVTDGEALAAFMELVRSEGIIPALESAHALAFAMKRARMLPKKKKVVVCLSGRGDKDIDILREHIQIDDED